MAGELRIVGGMRRLVMIVCVLAAMSVGARPGQTESVREKPRAAPDPPVCTDGMPVRVSAVILDVVYNNSQMYVVLSAGRNSGVARGWTGHVLRSDLPLPHGEIEIVRAEKAMSVGKVRLTPDVLRANPHVKLTPPP